MKIYTRTGDAGTTGLYGGGRVAKNDIRIAAYGAVDELNAALGVCRSAALPREVDDVVATLQHELFALGAELASPSGRTADALLLDAADVERAEAAIDRFDAQLPPLRTFVLPGGSPASAALHVARAVCRRAERDVVALAGSSAVRPCLLEYLNRVSDLLFVLARYANHAASVADIPWEKKSGK